MLDNWISYLKLATGVKILSRYDHSHWQCKFVDWETGQLPHQYDSSRYSPDQRCRSPRLQFLASVTVAPATYRISYWDCPNAGCNTVLRPDRCPPDADRDVAARTMDAPRVTNPQSVGIYYRKSFGSNGEFDIVVVVVFCWLGFWVNFRLNVMLVICWVKQIYIREGNGFGFGFYI